MWEFYWKLIFDVKTSFNLSNSGVPPSVSLPHAESKIEILQREKVTFFRRSTKIYVLIIFYRFNN